MENMHKILHLSHSISPSFHCIFCNLFFKFKWTKQFCKHPIEKKEALGKLDLIYVLRL